MRGWLILVLGAVGIWRIITMDYLPSPAAQAAEPPVVVTIEDDAPPQVTPAEPEKAKEPEPAKEPDNPPAVEKIGPSLEDRVSALEAYAEKLADNETKALAVVKESQNDQRETLSLFGRLVEEVEKLQQIDKHIIDKVKSIRSCQCPPPKTEASPPADAKPPAPSAPSAPPKPAEPQKPPVAMPVKSAVAPLPAPVPPFRVPPPVVTYPQKHIVMETMDTEATGIRCAPCERWKLEVLPAAQADGYTVEIVPTQTGSVPRFTVYYGDLKVHQNSFMSHKRLKQFEQAVAAERARLGR